MEMNLRLKKSVWNYSGYHRRYCRGSMVVRSSTYVDRCIAIRRGYCRGSKVVVNK